MIEKDLHTQMLFKDEEQSVVLERGGKRRCMGCMRICDYDDEKCPNCGYPKKPKKELPLYSLPGTRLNNRYILGKLISYDGYQATYLGYDESLNQKVFLREYLPENLCIKFSENKIITLSEPYKSLYEFGLGRFLQESELCSGFRHSGIVRVHNVFEFGNTAYAVAAYEDGKTLKEYLADSPEAFDYKDTLSIVLQIGEALEYLHDFDFAFLNITPENIWITDDGDVKLLWPGRAENELRTRIRSVNNTSEKKPYLAFEQYGDPYVCNSSTDVYSLAAVMYRLTFFEEPVSAYKRYGSIEKSGKDPMYLSPKRKSKVRGFSATALENAMQVNPNDRTPDIITFVGELTDNGKVKRRKTSIKKFGSYGRMLWFWTLSGIACAAMVTVALLSVAGIVAPTVDTNIAYEIEAGKVSVPNFLASDYKSALKTASENGLILSVKYKAENPCVGKNVVLYQQPAAMEQVGYGSTVHIVVSSGSGTDIVRDVVGFNSDSAREILESIGFLVRIEDGKNSDYSRNVVFSQSVEPGVELEKGSEITLTVSGGNDSVLTSKEITIPNLIGKTFEEALERVKGTGCYIVIEKYESDPKKGDGVIISQTPNAYISERAGTVIAVVINKSESGCYMPNVSYLPLTEAKKKLNENGLKWKLSYSADDSVDENVVIGQSVSVGTFVQKGSSVTLTVNIREKIETPELCGKTYYSARQELMKLGISSTLKNPDVPITEKSCVVWQSEPSGKKLTRGSEIILDISETE